MSLHANKLRHIAKDAITVKILKESAKKMFGPTFYCNDNIVDVCDKINEFLYECKTEGRIIENELKTSILLSLKDHSNVAVRKMVVQLLPESFLKKFYDDDSDVVRFYVAQRLSKKELLELKKRHPSDLMIETVLSEKKLSNNLEPFELVEKDKADPDYNSGKAQQLSTTKQVNDIELSDTWYETAARNILNQYGEFSYGTPRHVERHWNPLAVKRFCASTKATSGVVIDQQKLQDAVDAALEQYDDELESRCCNLAKIKESLQKSVRQQKIDSIPVLQIVEDVDVVDKLLYESLNFREEFENLFKVEFKTYKPNIHELCECIELYDFSVPCSCVSPKSFIDESSDKAISKYVSRWNSLNESKNIRLTWNVSDKNKVSFKVTKG